MACGAEASLAHFSLKMSATITVNGDTYRTMSTYLFVIALHGIDVNKVYFQQDGLTCHTSQATIDLLRQTSDDRLISRSDDANWQSRLQRPIPFVLEIA